MVARWPRSSPGWALGASLACSQPGWQHPLEAPPALSLPLAEAGLAGLEGRLIRLEAPLYLLEVGGSPQRLALRLGDAPVLLHPGQRGSGEAAFAPRAAALHSVSVRWAGVATEPPPPGQVPRLGSRAEPTTGVVYHAEGEFHVSPRGALKWQAAPRPPAPPVAPLRVVAFNVQNYFLEAGRRGARTEAERLRQRDALAGALEQLAPALAVLSELQAGGEAAEELGAAVSERLGRRLAAVRLAGGCSADEIEVGMLFDPARLDLEQARWLPAEGGRRCPLLARFSAAGAPLAVVGVHAVSKRCGSGSPSVQQDCGASARQREISSLAAQVAELRASADRVLVAGDFNAYPAERSLLPLRRQGLVELLASVGESSRYSYRFRGFAGLLDQLWASPRLARDARTSGIWHINADEPRLEPEGPFASSDHDPVWVTIDTSDWR